VNPIAVDLTRPRALYERVPVVVGATGGRIDVDGASRRGIVLVTDGHLPYPYGWELTGYETTNLDTTVAKARSAGARVLVKPYSAGDRRSSFVQFPGGYIAEIHATSRE